MNEGLLGTIVVMVILLIASFAMRKNETGKASYRSSQNESGFSEDPLHKIREKISGSLDINKFRASNGEIEAKKLLHYIGYLSSEEQKAQVGIAGIQIENADLRGANLPNARFGFLSLQEASFQDAVLEYSAFIISNLAGADFTNANLGHAHFISTTLIEAKFHSIYGYGLQIRQSDLRKVDFSDAQLHGLVITDCQVEETSFVNAWLRDAFIAGECIGVNFQKAQFHRADLSNAVFVDCFFEGAEYDDRTNWPIDFDPIGAGCLSKQDVELLEEKESQKKQLEIEQWSQKADELRQKGYKIPLLKEMGDRILEIVKVMAEEPSNRLLDSDGNFNRSLKDQSPLEYSYWLAAHFVLDDMILEQTMGAFLGPSWKETLASHIYIIQEQEVQAILKTQNQQLRNEPPLEESQDAVSLIERLARLHELRILSDEEFQKKKAELLNRI